MKKVEQLVHLIGHYMQLAQVVSQDREPQILIIRKLPLDLMLSWPVLHIHYQSPVLPTIQPVFGPALTIWVILSRL